MTEVEKDLYRDKNGKLLGQCAICKRQLVRLTTSIYHIIPELEARQSEKNPNFCWACDNLEYAKRMQKIKEIKL